MKRGVLLLLVVGVAAAAALPLQDPPPATLTEDLLKILLANPDANELTQDIDEERGILLASPTNSLEELAQGEGPKEEDEPKQEVQLGEETVEKQGEAVKEEAKEENPIEEQGGVVKEEEKQETKQEEEKSPQPQEQTQETKPEQETSDEPHNEPVSQTAESTPNTKETQPNLQPIPVDEHGMTLAGGEGAFFDHEISPLPIEPEENDYVVIHLDKQPTQDADDTFPFGLLLGQNPFVGEPGPVILSPEQLSQINLGTVESQEQEESHAEPLSEQREREVEQDYEEVPFSEQRQPQTEQDYEEVPFSQPQTDQDYEHQEPTGEEPIHDYETLTETDQPSNDENTPMEPQNGPDPDYYQAHPDRPLDYADYEVEPDHPEKPVEYSERMGEVQDHSSRPDAPEDYTDHMGTPGDYSDNRDMPVDNTNHQNEPVDYYDYSYYTDAPLDYSEHQDQPVEYSDNRDTPVDHSSSLLSFVVPDYYEDEKPNNQDYDALYKSRYYIQVPAKEGEPQYNPEALHEREMTVADRQWEDPSVSEVNNDGDANFSIDSLLGSGDVLVVETVPLGMTIEEESSDDANTNNESRIEFFIPTYSDSPYTIVTQEYPSDTTQDEDREVPQDEAQDFTQDDQFVSSTGAYPVDDGLVTDTPLETDDMAEFKLNKIILDMLSAKWKPVLDDSYPSSFTGGEEMGEQREESEMNEAVIPTFETQDEGDDPYPSIIEIIERDMPVERSLMIDFPSEDETTNDDMSPQQQDYLSQDNGDDDMEIIVINDGENYEDFSSTPLESDPYNNQDQQTSMWYQDEDQQQPYNWEPQVTSVRYQDEDQQNWGPQLTSIQSIPKVQYSVMDEAPMKQFHPGFFDRMNDETYPSPMFNNYHETPVYRDPFAYMNEIPDNDNMQPQFFASSSSRQHRFTPPTSPFASRSYSEGYTSPRLSFPDVIQSLRPSYYDTMHINNYHTQSPSQYYPQSYNPFLQYKSYNVPQKQYMHASPIPYSSPFTSYQDNYLGGEKYYSNGLQRLSSFNGNNDNMPSGIFREDTMTGMNQQQPQNYYYEGYTNDLPFAASSYQSYPSYRSSRSLFPTYDRFPYADNSPYNSYSQNRYHGSGPYYQTPYY